MNDLVIPSGAAKRRSRGIAWFPTEALARDERDSSTAAPDGASARNDNLRAFGAPLGMTRERVMLLSP